MTIRDIPRREFIKSSVALGAGLASMSIPGVVRAKDFPTQPIRLVVGTAAVGINDLVARLIAPIMEKELGQPVIVDNKPGAAQKLALQSVVKAPADGHTLLVSSSAILATAVTHSSMPADPVNDLAHITMIADGSFTFAVNTKLGITTLQDFVTLAKKNPGKIKYGASGAGSAIHLCGELFSQRMGVSMVAVQYTNVGQRIADLLANEIQMSIHGLSAIAQHITAGGMLGLVVAGREREPTFPNIPTTVELGIADVDSVSNWFGLHAPKRTPAPVIKALYEAANKAIKDASVREKLIVGGLRPIGDMPEELAARLKRDHGIFGTAAREAKIKIED
jgi:tripartite-type tricarboxylate transporter receptor subunit TctC